MKVATDLLLPLLFVLMNFSVTFNRFAEASKNTVKISEKYHNTLKKFFVPIISHVRETNEANKKNFPAKWD